MIEISPKKFPKKEESNEGDETIEVENSLAEFTPSSVSGCGCGMCSIHKLCTSGCPKPDHSNRVDPHHPLTTLGQRKRTRTSAATCTAQTVLVETTVHTSGEDRHTEPSSKLFKFDRPVTDSSWDPLDTPYQPTNRIEDDRNIEPREPQELEMCMGEEWRERKVQDRLSQHIAHCPLGTNCGDRICKYFNWFQRHYSQCVRQECRSCIKYRHWMECHAKNCHYKSRCVLPFCKDLKVEVLRQLFCLQRQEASEALMLHSSPTLGFSDSLVGILRPKSLHLNKKTCHLSNNSSTTADSSFGSSYTHCHYTSCFSDFGTCSSVDIKTCPEEDSPTLEEPPPNNKLSTLERQLTFQNGPLMVEDPQSMRDSASILMCSESMLSFYSSLTTPNDVDQTTPSSPSTIPALSSVAPLPGPRMSQAEIHEAMTRIDTCLAQNRDRISAIDNDHAGTLVQQCPLNSTQKTEDQLEAPYPFLPKGCVPDFDMDCVQGCKLMASKEFGDRGQLYYKQMVMQPLPEEEGAIERHLAHRNSVKQYLQGQFYHDRVYREGEHWERLCKLGSGKKATCFVIADKRSNSLLVLKEEKEDVKTLDEAYICLKLACLTKNAPPNIVEYFGAAMLPSHPHPSTVQLFLELMPTCLQGYLFKCGPLSMETVHHYAYQLFDAVDFLHHKLKIIHCDIKPANLLINHNVQRLKVADFGCAELLEECHLGSCFRGNENAGTLAYNPPEHYRDKRCSFAFDIWQSGCSVLAMCTGKRPWRHLFMDCINRSERGQQMKIHYKHMHMISQQYSGHVTPAFLSEGIQQVLFGCLHSDYKQRPSAQDCMYLLATSEADSRNPQFLPSFQPDPNRLDVYLGVPYHTTTIAGLNHTLQGGWLGWISYHDGLSYRDACGMISSQLPVSQHFGAFSLNVCENQPQAIWRTLNNYEAGAPFQRVAENSLVDRTKAIIVRPTAKQYNHVG